MTDPEIDLFPVSRTTDPSTSHMAERMIRAKRPSQMLRILREYMTSDMSDEQAAVAIGSTHHVSGRRCADLRNAGLIEDTGRRIMSSANTPVMVCRITDEGRRIISNTQADWTQTPAVMRRVAEPDGTVTVGAQGHPAAQSPQSADLEARVEDADTVLAGLVTEAYEAGEMAGFHRGYEQGCDAAMKRPGALLEAKQIGHLEGRKQQAARTMALITEMRQAMKGKGPVEVHSTTCWQRHPMCAIDSIRKAQEIR
jgi:hypothetical protein